MKTSEKSLMSKAAKIEAILASADAKSKVAAGLNEAAAQLEREASEMCSHPEEQVRQSRDKYPSSRPWRICLQCGYAEEGYAGWKIKYSGSSFDVPEISHKDFMKLRRFFRTERHITHESICVPHHKREIDVWKCDGVCS